MSEACLLSVIVKTLNEEANIGRTLDHIFEAIKGLSAEVIVADSLSDDRTVEIARSFPVKIAQLRRAADKSCGVGGQLGYQHAQGRFILMMDGDMDLQREFLLAALERLQRAPDIAGVGGIVEDVNFDNLEYRARKQRAPKDGKPGKVDRLYGGGLFRREAIEAVGYFTNRNLHACEELEQGLRLTSAGWVMERLPMVSVYHHGHTLPILQLMKRRWQSRYAWGAGELLRAAYGKSYFLRAVRCFFHLIVVLAWWSSLVALAAAWMLGLSPLWFFVVLLTPPLLMVWRKKSLPMAGYSVLAWSLDAAGLLRGLLVSQQEPQSPISSVVLADGVPGMGKLS
jgi:glycosyltransferase involved in cell wall biosynthesis